MPTSYQAEALNFAVHAKKTAATLASIGIGQKPKLGISWSPRLSRSLVLVAVYRRNRQAFRTLGFAVALRAALITEHEAGFWNALKFLTR
jgi:hypothetical protein